MNREDSVPSSRESGAGSPATGRIIRLVVPYATDFDRVSAGGIAAGLKELARNLNPRFQLSIAGVGDGPFETPARKQVDGVNLTIRPVLHHRVPRLLRWLRIPLNLVFTIRLFWLKARIEHLADVILPRRMESALPFIIGKKRPVVLSIHGMSKHLALPQTGFLRWRMVQVMYRFVEAFVLSKVDRVVIVGRDGYEYYRARFPNICHKFLFIPNSINMSRFSPIGRAVARPQIGLKDSDLVIAYAGRLSAEKRISLLIECFAIISHTRPEATLLIAGEGPEQGALQKQIAELGLSKVRFLGWLGREQLRTLLSSTDVFVMLSWHEGFSNAALEALACGVPVVTTDVGGMREMLGDGLRRFIVSSLDPTVVGMTILEAADQRMSLVEACLNQARQYDARAIVPKLEGLYAGLVGARECEDRDGASTGAPARSCGEDISLDGPTDVSQSPVG
jgi:glycosyltransferase involved in cell wall biosynthesis